MVPRRRVPPSPIASPPDAVAPRATIFRLQKFLAVSGVDSRRNSEEYIRQGRVTVDGEVVTDPAASVDPSAQHIALDGERLQLPRFRYYLLNKPMGVLCTNRDPQGRPRAVDLIPDQGQRLFTVGRLDESTEGLLLITNDGELADRMAHPRYEVVRRYRCHVAGVPTRETLTQLRQGMYFTDGFFRFREVRLLKRKGRSCILELELREGKNREIRRLMARVGHKVLALQRVSFGPLRLGHLAPGQFRELRASEISELRRFAWNPAETSEELSNRRPLPRGRTTSADPSSESVTARPRRPGTRGQTSTSGGTQAAGRPAATPEPHGKASRPISGKPGKRKLKPGPRQPGTERPAASVRKGRDRKRR